MKKSRGPGERALKRGVRALSVVAVGPLLLFLPRTGGGLRDVGRAKFSEPRVVW